MPETRLPRAPALPARRPVPLAPEAIDTQTPTGRAMWQMIGVLAELERSLIAERTRAAKFGRKRKLTPAHVADFRKKIAAGQRCLPECRARCSHSPFEGAFLMLSGRRAVRVLIVLKQLVMNKGHDSGPCKVHYPNAIGKILEIRRANVNTLRKTLTTRRGCAIASIVHNFHQLFFSKRASGLSGGRFLVCGLILAAAPAFAAPLHWTFDAGTHMNCGITVSGFIDFDADTPTVGNFDVNVSGVAGGGFFCGDGPFEYDNGNTQAILTNSTLDGTAISFEQYAIGLHAYFDLFVYPGFTDAGGTVTIQTSSSEYVSDDDSYSFVLGAGSLTSQGSPTPEPATAGLTALAASALLIAAWRRRRLLLRA
jgi:Resolvase, N terminal domain